MFLKNIKIKKPSGALIRLCANKTFYANFYLIYMATYILYVWQLMCTEHSGLCQLMCITYSNLLPVQNIFKIYASGI